MSPDLAEAHLRALERWRAAASPTIWAPGAGHSVLEVIAAVEAATGRPVPHEVAPRRAGDAAALVASSARIRAETGWSPRHATLEEIARTAARWRLAHPAGYDD